ncbi:hypothetical protein IU462_27430 [Nocardia farcinica]|nr:hypothetical protein [Nocardia farcinica]
MGTMTSFQARLPASQIDDTYPCSSPFDFPIFLYVDELQQNGGAEPDGIKFTVKALGAGRDAIEVPTGFHIA